MKIWGVLSLFGFISCVNAHTVEKSDTQEERVGAGIPTHFDEDSFNNSSSKDRKSESSAFIKEGTEGLLPSQEEQPEPYIIVVTDRVAPPGGGIPLLDPKAMREVVLPPFPETEAPWWERWWDEVTEWFSDDDS